MTQARRQISQSRDHVTIQIQKLPQLFFSPSVHFFETLHCHRTFESWRTLIKLLLPIMSASPTSMSAAAVEYQDSHEKYQPRRSSSTHTSDAVHAALNAATPGAASTASPPVIIDIKEEQQSEQVGAVLVLSPILAILCDLCTCLNLPLCHWITNSSSKGDNFSPPTGSIHVHCKIIKMVLKSDFTDTRTQSTRRRIEYLHPCNCDDTNPLRLYISSSRERHI